MNQGISRIGKTFFQPIGIGTMKINISIQGYHKTLLLTNALYCLSLQANLILASQLLDKDVNISLTKLGCIFIALDGDIIAKAHAKYRLFLLHTWLDQQLAIAAYSSSSDLI
jgi:hypothetical protein